MLLEELAQLDQLAADFNERGATAALFAGLLGARHGRRRRGHARRRHLVLERAFAQELLNALDGVALIVKALPDAAQQDDVVRPIVAPAAGALQRLHLRKARLP